MQNKFMGSIVALLKLRDKKIARLYEQGASKERVGAYLRRWLGWAGTTCCWASVALSIGCAYNIEKMHSLTEYKCKDISIMNVDKENVAYIVAIDKKDLNHYPYNGIELSPGEHSVIYKYQQVIPPALFLLPAILEMILRQRHELKYDFIAGKIYLFDAKYVYENSNDKEGEFIDKSYVKIKYDRECIDDKDIRKDVKTKKD